MSGSTSNEEVQSYQHKYKVFVKNLPLLTPVTDLERYFTGFGEVKTVKLIHRNSHYTRSAKVKMLTKSSVRKILRQKEPHSLDGKKFQVMKYYGMATHEAEYVEGQYQLKLEGLFNPSSGNKAENEYIAYDICKRLENTFHKYKYTSISFERSEGRYNGEAIVWFKHGGKANKIMEKARKEFRERPNFLCYEVD